MISGRDAPWMISLALAAALGAIAIERELDETLDEIRAARATLLTRAALGEGRPRDGALTIVRETESAKYPFLNKRSYEIHTSSVARAGTVLRAGDEEDKARADRHAEARRKKTPLRTRLEGGAWRVTIAEGTRSAELVIDPPPVPRPSPWPVTLVALGVAIVIGLLVRLKLSQGIAALVGFGVMIGGLFAIGEGLLGEASLLATQYLAESGTAAPAARLGPVGVRTAIAIASILSLAILGLVASPFGVRSGRALWRDRGAYGSIAPAMIGLGVLVGIPFAFGVGLSFFRHDHGHFTFVGLSNFTDILFAPGQSLFRPQTLPYSLAVTIIWTALNVMLHLAIGLALALLLRGVSTGISRLYRVILIVPWAVPSYLTALIWRSMFDPDLGAVNRLFGIEGTSWMNSFGSAFLANLMTNVWLGVPFMMVVCLGALTSIPAELYEAAEVDGASRLEQLVNITLPLLKPALLPSVILGSIWTFNKFEVIYLVSEGRPDGATDILVTESYRWAFERGLAQGGAYGYAAAYSVVIFAVLLVYGWMTTRVARAAEEALR
jgi:ABC-type sugar transport system permease subunit